MAAASFVHVNVGGFPYSIAVSDIEKFPGSFFACMIKKEWTDDATETISIQRDGALFKFVYAYIVNGHLPRDKEGLIDLDDATLDGLKEEADFYGLVGLSKECSLQHRRGTDLDLPSYMTIRKYVAHLLRYGGNFQIDISSRLARTLKCVWSPFLVRGRLGSYSNLMLHKSSTMHKLNLAELIAAATVSPFGRGTESIVDTTFRNSFEVVASRLNLAVLQMISSQIYLRDLAPHLELTLRPYKLVIYKQGGHFDAHRDTVRGDGHIGTLVVILNSTYTGGELEVTHGGRTEVVTGPYSWVAMYGDCLHKINPVTSGTRVSLIYDIYGKEATEPLNVSVPDSIIDLFPTLNSNDAEEREKSDDEHFWEKQPKGRVNYRPKSTLPSREHLIEADTALIFEALDEDLQSFGTIIICLQHLYPECQTKPAFLKAGDRALYDILTSGSSALGKYDVQVVAATICRQHDYDDNGCGVFGFNETRGALFSPAIVKRALGIKTNADGSVEKVEPVVELEMPFKKQKTGHAERAKLVLSNNLEFESLLDYTPYNVEAGNEPQVEQSVYLVAGLQVRRRV